MKTNLYSGEHTEETLGKPKRVGGGGGGWGVWGGVTWCVRVCRVDLAGGGRGVGRVRVVYVRSVYHHILPSRDKNQRGKPVKTWTVRRMGGKRRVAGIEKTKNPGRGRKRTIYMQGRGRTGLAGQHWGGRIGTERIERRGNEKMMDQEAQGGKKKKVTRHNYPG